jgi:hypothetical protein
VLQWQVIPREQEVPALDRMTEGEGDLFVFVSHRWETLTEPDPQGRQLRALQYLLKCLQELLQSVDDALAQRANDLQCVHRHGYPQALVLLFRLLANLRNVPDGAVSDILMRRIGIWYDFACIPQAPRTEPENLEIEKQLLDLPELLLSKDMTLLALREQGDDFENRAWCVFENILTHDGDADEPMVLRVDRVGEQIPARQQAADDPVPAALAAWETRMKTPELLSWSLNVLGAMLSVNADDHFSCGDGPALSMARFSNAKSAEFSAGWLTSLVAASRQSIDMAKCLVALARKRGLKSAKEEDLIFTLLGILRLSHTGRLGELVDECRERHIQGRSLQMRVTFDDRLPEPIRLESLAWVFVQP